MNKNLHVYCPKCGSEVELADGNIKASLPYQEGDFFLRLKNNTPEQVEKLKNIIRAMYGDDVEMVSVGPVKETVAPQKTTARANPFTALSRHRQQKDDIEESILEDGDINSRFLWRRWIMAQVLRHYKTADGQENFHNYFIKSKTMHYVLKMCLNEAKALNRLQGIDLKEREMFFNLDVFRQIVKDYIKEYKTELFKQLEKLDLKNRETVYKKGFGTTLLTKVYIGKKTFDKDDAKDIVRQLNEIAEHDIYSAENYEDMAKLFADILHKFPPFKSCRKSKAWMDAFKGAGAFYTLDNLLHWHNCLIRDEKTNEVYSGDRALKYLRDRTKALPSKEYYKLYAIMKRVVKENHFDFSKRMEELRNGGVA